jgi:hypothetical protein
MQPNEAITYIFHLAQGRTERIVLTFDPDNFLLQVDPALPAESWMDLGFRKCAHCPLAAETHPLCPFAHALGGFIHGFDSFYSYERAVVEVVTAQRTIVAERPLQDAMASILGLIGATSGCPHLAFLRPMARFHLPFASEQETLVRVFAYHLLGSHLRSEGTDAAGIGRLETMYREVAQVNLGMAERIRGAFAKDAVVNAIIILDTFAQAVPFVVRDALQELQPLFAIAPAQSRG